MHREMGDRFASIWTIVDYYAEAFIQLLVARKVHSPKVDAILKQMTEYLH